MRLALLWLLLCALSRAEQIDYFMRIQQTLGSTNIVRASAHMHQGHSLTVCACNQAAKEGKFDVASSKLDQIEQQVKDWKGALAASKAEAENPTQVEPEPEIGPPEESVEFTINATHVPAKCPRKSMAGSIMRVHYVGKLLSNKKIFASSFHTGSMPLRFTLGSDEVVQGWNEGLVDMCEGERRRLMVPWNLAYGKEGSKGVPPYSDVQYDFELTELSNPKIPKGRKSKSEL